MDQIPYNVKGERTLIQTLLWRAQVDPEHIFGSFPLTDDISDGFRDFTVKELVQAVDTCAWSIRERYGLSTNHETLLYMGASDFRYTIVFFAAIKCGYKACFQNPKNPRNDNVSILERTNCVKAVHSCEMEDLIKEYQASRPELTTLEVPSLVNYFDRQSTSRPAFPFEPKSWQDAKHDPILVLHSSGTTGSPKPVVLRNGYVGTIDREWRGGGRIVSIFEQQSADSSFIYAPFLAFHIVGFFHMTIAPTLAANCAVEQPPPTAFPGQNGLLAIAMMGKKNVRSLTASPILLNDIAKRKEGIQALAQLDVVVYAGGPLRSSLGDELCESGVRLRSMYGSTEAGIFPTLTADPSNWQWLHLHPDLEIDWQDQGEGVYELCFSDKGSASTNESRGSHWTVQTEDWRTKDLFIKHPHKEHLWKFVGRQDDMLLLAHGDKVNPIPVEDLVSEHALVSGALMAGENKWPPCMLIELKEDDNHDGGCDEYQLKQNVWPQVEKANTLLRHDSRIPYTHVLLVAAGSFVRNPKGSVVRTRTTNKHTEMIEKLYVESGKR